MADAQSPISTLRKRFGLQAFRKGQWEILNSVLAGQDTLAIMPTGGGKSLCYQLPALVKDGLVLVVSPLISLMNDQVAALRKLGIPAGCIHSGQSQSEKKAIFAEIETSPSFLLYLSPERVQKAGFAGWIGKQKLTLFAIDEAHCISIWGHDFRRDYSRLELLRQLRPDVPMLALTATATPQVITDVSTRLNLRNPQKHIHGFYRPNLYYQVVACEDETHKLVILRQALRQNPVGRVIVYCGTRKGCEELAGWLAPDFPGTGYYHAGLSAEQRSGIQQDFAEGRIRILTATNAFGMGIDHPDVRLVVHFQIPGNLESYYQEIGRAGRDGEDSTCLLLYLRKDKGLQSYFIRESDAPPEVIRHRWNALNTMIQYAEGGECRHEEILAYFHDVQRIHGCGHCDICAPASTRAIQVAGLAKKPQRAKRQRRSSRNAMLDAPLKPHVQHRMEVLRAWRKAYARENDIAAFMVFSNKTLNDICLRNPRTRDELLEVYGMGGRKIERFGNELLGELSTVH